MLLGQTAHQITFKEGESLMYRSKFPMSVNEFCQMLPTTTFAVNLKATINLDERVAVIFFSKNIYPGYGRCPRYSI